MRRTEKTTRNQKILKIALESYDAELTFFGVRMLMWPLWAHVAHDTHQAREQKKSKKFDFFEIVESFENFSKIFDFSIFEEKKIFSWKTL